MLRLLIDLIVILEIDQIQSSFGFTIFTKLTGFKEVRHSQENIQEPFMMFIISTSLNYIWKSCKFVIQLLMK